MSVDGRTPHANECVECDALDVLLSEADIDIEETEGS
jgi:hypothetical protein